MHELLDTVQGRTLVESAEERGYIEPAELEALALELDLGDEEVAEFTHELESIGLEIGPPVDRLERYAVNLDPRECPLDRLDPAQLPQELAGAATQSNVAG